MALRWSSGSTSATIDQLLTTTLDAHRDKFVDNFFEATPLATFLKDNVKLKSGGAQIVEPLMYNDNSTFTGFNNYETLFTITDGALVADDILKSAIYEWKQWSVTVAISGLEEDQNSGEAELIDLLEAKIDNAEMTMVKNVNDFLINSDGTSGAYAKLPHGLETYVKTTANTVGGIDASSATWWGVGHHSSSATALTIADMTTAYNTASEGSDHTNVILTTQALYEKYEGLLQPQERFADRKVGDAGFESLMFKRCPIVFDGDVASGDMFFLNTKYLYLVGLKDTWFRTTPFVRSPDRDARYAQILCRGQLVVTNRNRQGYLGQRT